MATKLVGIDVGTAVVRAAEVEVSSRSMDKVPLGTVTRFAEAPVQPGAVVEGDVVDSRAVVAAIKQAISQGGFTTKDVVVGVGSARTVVREMNLATMPLDQLRKALPFQVEESLPMPTDEALLDFYPTAEEDGPNGAVLRGIMVAAAKRSVSSMVMAADQAGLNVKAVDLRAFGLVRSLVPGQWQQSTVALVDIGARSTTIVVVDNGAPRLVRILANGGHDITEAIASTMQQPMPEAEQIKARYGLGSIAEVGNQTVTDGVMNATKTVVDGIRNTILYYSGNNGNAQFQQIVLTGGGAQLAGLGQYLASACRLPVSYGNAAGALKLSKRMEQQFAARSSQFATAVGLAMVEV